MSLLVIQQVSKSWSDADVLRNVSASLAPGDRVGLVGPNGQGKSTLMRIIAGVDGPTSGTVQRASDLRIGYLPQDPPVLSGQTLWTAMLEVFGGLHAMEQQLTELAHAMEADSDPKLVERYGRLQHEYELAGGYGYVQKVEEVLTGLGFAREAWRRPMEQLSGGQRTRAYLGRLLLEEPGLLLLDEPTNHLDLSAVEWLEQWLEGYKGGLIVVSHDRWFLDRVTTATWEVAFATLEDYRGNYSHYVTQRSERFKQRLRQWEGQQQFIAETEDFIRRFIAGQRSSEAKGRRTRLERFMRDEAIERPREHPRITVRLRAVGRTGDIVLQADDLAAGYTAGRPLAQSQRLEVFRGQRIAIVGPNGCGKTTLLRTLTGQLPSLAGKVRWGANVTLGALSQTHDELGLEETALEALRRAERGMTEERARALLGSLLLSGDDAFKRIRELSGGQRSRVALARLIVARANVLVLDEPTNHLDIQSQEVLQDVLSEFDGTVLFVSHDRYLIRALATDIWALADGEIHPLKGDWDRYVSWRRERMGLPSEQAQADAAERARQQNADDHRQRRRKTNETQRLQRRFAQVEELIAELESALKTIDADLAAASASGELDKIARLGQQHVESTTRLQELMDEWAALGTQLEGTGDQAPAVSQ
jgi:ATP-binding cassette subfamily F protein 3